MLSQKEVKRLFNYDKNTGIFTWKKKPNNLANFIKIGMIAGTINAYHGYTIIVINKKHYKAHRLAWLYEYGYYPKIIDHINHNKSDNGINNLRDVTGECNMKNKLQYDNNTSGVTGVSWCNTHKRWKSRISVDGKRISLGAFTEFHEAVNARKNAEVLYGYHENHGKTLEEIQGAEYE